MIYLLGTSSLTRFANLKVLNPVLYMVALYMVCLVRTRSSNTRFFNPPSGRDLLKLTNNS